MASVSNPPAARPTGVTIVAILAFVMGGMLFMGALLMLLGGATLAAFFGSLFPAWLTGMLGALAIVLAMVLAALGALYLMGGMGLLQGRSWAWMVAIVLAGLGALNGLLSLPGSIVGLALHALVIWYFFTPPVKAFFGKSHVNALWERRAPAS